jgi:hypothetical protein
MTEWGMLLVCAYIALGATGRLTRRQAGRAAFALTVVVIVAAVIGYRASTPVDKYIPMTDATIYRTGRPPPPTFPPQSITEDQTGATAATWFTTDHGASGGGGGG